MKIYNNTHIPEGLGNNQPTYEEMYQAGYESGYTDGYADGLQ